MGTLRLVDHYFYKDILHAYIDCRKSKRQSNNASAFEINFEHNLLVLLNEINNRQYEISSTCIFPVLKPTPREICAAMFRDRIVHHLIYTDLGSYFESRAIEDSFACMVGRGTLAASDRLDTFCRRATQHWSKPAWYLKIDIAGFFSSINRSILWNLIRKEIGTESLTSWLIQKIYMHDPMQNAYFLPGVNFSKIPAHKRLQNAKPGYGLPIGNLTSQFGSGIYLDGLDKYVKHVLKVKWYVRYVDDMVLLSHNRDELYHWKEMIDTWLQMNRELHLHPNKTKIGPADSGIDFVGRIIHPYRKYPRNRNVHALKQIVHQVKDKPMTEKAVCQINSYLGYLRTANTYHLRKHIVMSPVITQHAICDQ